MLIKTYGLFWNPDIIDWSKNEMFGNIKIEQEIKKKKQVNTYKINCYSGKGVYVLYNDFKVVYIGQATMIGDRVKAHLTDRLAGRWDMFSWFSISNATIKGRKLDSGGTRQVKPETVVDTLEALLIMSSDPLLNRRHEKLPTARIAEQAESHKPYSIRAYLENILQKVEKVN